MRVANVAVGFLIFAASLMCEARIASAETKAAIFAGGCFWCVERDFDHVPGVTATTSGYTGGTSENPTYEDYVAGGHREAVKVEYDAAKVTYATLLEIFWHSVDPTDAGGQFCDRGPAYATAIYALDRDEFTTAERSKLDVEKTLGKPVATEIVTASAFWPAEQYHQDYSRKNPVRYRYYRYSCGRDATVEALWGEAAHQGIDGD